MTIDGPKKCKITLTLYEFLFSFLIIQGFIRAQKTIKSEKKRRGEGCVAGKRAERSKKLDNVTKRDEIEEMRGGALLRKEWRQLWWG